MSGIGKKLKEITINRYINLLKLPIIKNEEYYWIMNDYLYVNNPLLKAIRISALFEEDVPNDLLYPECCCGENIVTEDYCMNPLDKPYGLPGYLQTQVLELATKKLMSTYFATKTDITSDGLDGQAPNVPNNR